MKAFCRKVHKRNFKDIETVDLDINREYLTQHGLHMNVSGKKKIERKIINIRKIVTR
jgi:hypothetical protein